MWNQPIESMARSELEALQLSRLQNALKLVDAKVPFYKKLFTESGIKPGSIKTLGDLKQLPFTSKSDVREEYPYGLFATPLADVKRLHASSGTKGKPTIAGYTKNDLDNWAEVCARSLAAAGVRPGDIVQNAYGYGLFTGGLGLHYGAEHLGANIIPASVGRTQQQILLLQDLGARAIFCTPSYALNIGYAIEELQCARNTIKLELGILGAEPWTNELRSQIEEKLKIKALDIYGLSEIIGPGVSQECFESHGSPHRSLHIWEDHFLPEIIDPKTGQPLPLGEEGELVFTCLTKEAVPLIRYRTGDISHLIPDRCTCGRTMIRMSAIKARFDDMLIIRGVNVYPSEIEKVLLQMKELAPYYRIIVGREKALDTIEVQAEVSERMINHGQEFKSIETEITLLSNRIVSTLKDTLGFTAQVSLYKPQTLPRSEGKATRVIDERNATYKSDEGKRK